MTGTVPSAISGTLIASHSDPAERPAPTRIAFWWQHARLPLLLLACLVLVTGYSTLDEGVARGLFYDAVNQRWIGAHNWWVNSVLHVAGRWFVRGLVAAALVCWLMTFVRPQWRPWRRPSLYFIVAMVLAIGTVGLLKAWTNVDCPWDLQEFGGQFPYVHLFAHRSVSLRHAQCFPAAHASSGYALMALYFMFRERSSRVARLGLMTGMVLGLLFGIAQQSRGAHFFSHDLWSACITWTVSLSVYSFAFGMRAWRSAASV